MKTSVRLMLCTLIVATSALLWAIFHPPIDGYYSASFIKTIPSSQLRFLEGKVFLYCRGKPERIGNYTQSSVGEIVWTFPPTHTFRVKPGWLFLTIDPQLPGGERNVRTELRDLRFWKNPSSKPPADTPDVKIQ